MPLHIARGNRQRLAAHVRPPHLGVGGVMGDRDRDATATGADVGHAHRPVRFARDLDRPLHQHLCVGVRDEHVGSDLEVEAHEFLVADQIGDRLAFGPPRHQGSVCGEVSL